MCVYVDESQERIDQVAAPDYVSVVAYNYATHRDDWVQYADKSAGELYDDLFMHDLPGYGVSAMQPPRQP